MFKELHHNNEFMDISFSTVLLSKMRKDCFEFTH